MTKYLLLLAPLLLCVACENDINLSVDSAPGDNDPVDDNSQPDIDNYVVPDDIGAMVDVPAGEFQMGCNETVDNLCEAREYPYHAVTLSAYKIGKYEVTVGEYQQCVTNGACNNSGEYKHYYTNTDSSYCNYGAEGKGSHPMQCVTWYGAKAFCEWIGGRLPTEAEWEKAARSTDGRIYPWGNEPVVSCDYAVMFASNPRGFGCGAGGTMPVGSKPKGVSPYGAYDMLGNVWEWVNDWYDADYYASSPTNNPMGPETGDERVLHGGSWYYLYIDFPLRVSRRISMPSGEEELGGVYGFRCVK